MKIYIDDECKCHVSNPNGTYTEVEAPEKFIGKGSAYIEGFRYKPYGFTYTRNDGESFGPEGESITPWEDLALLNRFQAQYEAQLAAAAAAYAEGVNSI